MLDKENRSTESPVPGASWLETPPRVAPLEAVSREWPVVAAVTVLCVAIAIAVALAAGRPYYAEVQFTLLPQDLGAPGALTGFPETAQALATSYSRAVDSDTVINRMPARLRRGDVKSRLEASPIPESPVFRVKARGDSAEEAVELVNAAAVALSEYAEDAVRPSDVGEALLEEYRERSRQVAALEQEKSDLEDANGPSEELDQVTSELNVERLRAGALRDQYRSLQAVKPGALLTLQGEASVSDAYRSTGWLAYIGAGLLAGLLIGSALAIVRAQRRFRRFAGS